MSALPAIEGGRLVDRRVLNEGRLARALLALDGGGEETRLVGGAVRDLVLGERPGDFDLATTATTDEVTRRARAAGFKVVPTGVTHGTVTVIVDGLPIETTTLRLDVETDGRHAKVAFGRDFALDAQRRDFTINALSLGRDGIVHDYVGGLDDVAARRVRFIGDAHQRIREDYLRILRFFRFSARFGAGPLDPQGLAAAVSERDGLARLSHERVRAELLKLLAAPRAVLAILTMGECGLLSPLIGGVGYCARLGRLVAIEAARGASPDPLLRLAALGVVIVEDVQRLRALLRLANSEYDRLAAAAGALPRWHGLVSPPSLGDLRAALFELTRAGALDALSLAHAGSCAAPTDPLFLSAYRFLADTPEPHLPFTGADIVARGIARGQRVGAALRAFQALWIRAGFPKEPETLSQLLDRAIAEAARDAAV